MSRTSIFAVLLSSAVVLTASGQVQPLPPGAPPVQRGVLGIGVDPWAESYDDLLDIAALGYAYDLMSI
jgi:hypothetical protein